MSTDLTSSPYGVGQRTAGGLLVPFNHRTPGLAASLVVFTGQGVLYGFQLYSAKTSAQFIQVFDARDVPADGAVPSVIFTVGASSNLPVNWIPGRTFEAGCVIVNSSTAATKTIGSADCWIDAQYL